MGNADGGHLQLEFKIFVNKCWRLEMGISDFRFSDNDEQNDSGFFFFRVSNIDAFIMQRIRIDKNTIMLI